MRKPLPILCNGRCEVLKASVHGVIMGTAAVCALYNLSAWIARRKPHLAINTALYTALTVWECVHVQHHVDEMPRRHRRLREEEPAA